MLKVLTKLIMAGGLCTCTSVQATATSGVGIALDWDSMAISGPLGNMEFGSLASGQIGSLYGGDSGDAYEVDGASAITSQWSSYDWGVKHLVGGFDSAGNVNYGVAIVQNVSGGVQEGWAGGSRGFYYQADGSGEVTVSVNYSFSGSVVTESPYDYGMIGYNYWMAAANSDLFLSTYDAALAAGDSTEAAGIAAYDAAILYTSNFSNYQALESQSCWGGGCTLSINQDGVLSLTFNVVSGTLYYFKFGAEVNAYTEVSSIPEPTAAWLFSSGLLVVAIAGAKRRRSDS